MPKFLKIDQLIDHISRYIQVRLDLAKADILGQLSGLIAGVFSFLLVLFLLAFFCLFVSFGISVLLNDWLDSNYLGYMIVAVFYAILFVLAIAMAKSGVLRKKIQESLEEDE